MRLKLTRRARLWPLLNRTLRCGKREKKPRCHACPATKPGTAMSKSSQIDSTMIGRSEIGALHAFLQSSSREEARAFSIFGGRTVGRPINFSGAVVPAARRCIAPLLRPNSRAVSRTEEPVSVKCANAAVRTSRLSLSLASFLKLEKGRNKRSCEDIATQPTRIQSTHRALLASSSFSSWRSAFKEMLKDLCCWCTDLPSVPT